MSKITTINLDDEAYKVVQSIKKTTKINLSDLISKYLKQTFIKEYITDQIKHHENQIVKLKKLQENQNGKDQEPKKAVGPRFTQEQKNLIFALFRDPTWEDINDPERFQRKIYPYNKRYNDNIKTPKEVFERGIDLSI